MHQLASKIQNDLAILAEEYEKRLQEIESAPALSGCGTEALELIAACLETGDGTRFVEFAQDQAYEWMGRGAKADSYSQALTALEEILIPWVRSVEDATLLWQTLSEARTSIARRTAEMLHESEEQLTALVQNAPLGIFVHQKGLLRYVGDTGASVLGYDEPSELVGRSILDFVYPEDREFIADIARRRVLGEPVPDQYEARLFHRDGSPINVVLNNTLIEYEGEMATLGAFVDITERKRLESELQETLDRRGRQVQTSTEVAQEIAAAPALVDLYERVVTLIKERFDYYHAQIFRYEPAVDAVVLVTSYGEIGERLLAAGHRLEMGRGVVGAAAATGQPVLAADVTRYPDWKLNPHLPATEGELAVPIKWRDKVLGILDVQSERAGALTDEDQILLEGLCGQIAAAIESTRLHQEMEDSLRELEHLYRAMSREGWEAFQREAGATGYLFNRADVVSVNDEWLPEMEEAAERQTLVPPTSEEHAAAVAPLAVRGEAFGVLGVQDDSRDPLSAEDLALVEAVSEQVAQALESARLFDEQQRARSLLSVRVNELDCLNDIGRMIDETPSIPEFLQWVAERVPSATQYPELSTVAVQYEGEVYGDADALDMPCQIVQNLRVGAERVGQVCIAYRETRGFLDEESALLGDIARRTSGYIESRRLFEQAQIRAKELAVLNELGRALPRCQDPDSALEEVYRRTSRLLDITSFYVVLYDSEREEIFVPLQVIDGVVERPHTPRPAGQGGLAEHLMKTQQPLLIPGNVGERINELGITSITLQPGRVSESWLGAPLMVGDRILGAMAVLSYTSSRVFDEHDRDLLTAIASQTSIALENVRLLEQARARAEQERLARTVTDRLRRGADREAIMRIALQELGQMLGASRAVVRVGTREQLLADRKAEE
jgi:PAS domain S-box-containing protein